VGYPMPSFLDTSRIMWPSQVYLLFEQLLDPFKGFDGERVYRSAGKYCGSYPKSFSARHRPGGGKLGGNILHADGHVECKSSVWKPQWDPDLEVPPRDDTNWYPYPVWE
jgi:prepilin-type processing-associated H-X9-DG protein